MTINCLYVLKFYYKQLADTDFTIILYVMNLILIHLGVYYMSKSQSLSSEK